MAVTLTAAALAAAIRVGDTAEETGQVVRLLAYSTEAVSKHLGTEYSGTAEAIVNEAVIRLAGYLYDQPQAGRGVQFSEALRNSGAGAILLPYRLHRAGTLTEAVAEAQDAVGTVDNPVVNVETSGQTLTVTFADGTTRDETLPAGGGGGGDDAYSWATVGDTTLIPAAKLRAPTSALRGAVVAVTNAIIDSDAHTASTLYGWSRSHVLRLIDRIVKVWARDDATPIPAAKLTLAPAGTQVFVQTSEPTAAQGPFRLDDIWIRDVTSTPFQIYKWTGTVWSSTFTFPGVTASEIAAAIEAFAIIGNPATVPGSKSGVYLEPPGDDLPTPTQAMYDANSVTALDGVWFYIAETGHEAPSDHWEWGALNEMGHNDLNQYRGSHNDPFAIPNPQVLDWAFVPNERRWVRRTSSTWVYNPAPQGFEARYRSENAAENGGLVTVGVFIFDSHQHEMRIIRDYSGSVPGPSILAWQAFHGDPQDLETWAFRTDSTRIQARKLGAFAQHDINAIPNSGEQHFELRARAHRNATGDLVSYDLGDWLPVSADPAGAGTSAIVESVNSMTLGTPAEGVYVDILTIDAARIVGGQTYLIMAEVDLSFQGRTGTATAARVLAAGSTTQIVDDTARQISNRSNHAHFTTYTAPATPATLTLAARWLQGSGTLTSFYSERARLILIPVTAG